MNLILRKIRSVHICPNSQERWESWNAIVGEFEILECDHGTNLWDIRIASLSVNQTRTHLTHSRIQRGIGKLGYTHSTHARLAKVVIGTLNARRV